jgi:hypothetical protein
VSFDNSRFTFDPFKNYAGVVMEQGRVQLDADWNEWLAELSRRIQAGTLDILGHAAYTPNNQWAFLITATSGSPNTVSIGCGRMYVDGLLAENHGLHKNAVWDPALAELSGNPQPINLSSPNPSPIDFTHQPWLPGAVTPTDSGAYLAYLDVWTRDLTWLEDPDLIDKAVGVDTTGRLQTVWQVKLMPNTGNWNCQTPDAQIPYPANSAGQLTSGVQPNTAAGPCCLTSGTGYTGVENQFYRVEIHNPGVGNDTPTLNGATFKWSRDNASVETGVTAIQTVQNSVNNTASQLSVLSLGRDQVLGFKNGDWIEILDDWSELWGNPGVLCQIDSVNPSPCTITLTTIIDTTLAAPGPGVATSFPVGANNLTDKKRRTRIRRWDQKGKVYDSHGNQWCDLAATGGLIPVPATKTLVLESGITVQFGLNPTSGTFNVADFWTFAARTADGSVEKLKAAPPRGIHHHYTKLSTLAFSNPPSYPDCRTPWTTGDEGACGCCSCTVGDNVNSFGKYSSIQQAINALPTTGAIPGGEVCILPGRYYEHVYLYNQSDVVIHGCGPETCLCSPSSQPDAAKSQDAAAPPVTPESGLAAVITVVGSSNITLRSFTIEAADGETCVLLDGTEVHGYNHHAFKKGGHGPVETGRTYDTEFPANMTISDLSLTASTLPAIVAIETYILKILNNRIAIEDTLSQWAAVYVSGTEIHVKDNWIGLQDAPNATEWMPSSVVADLPNGFNSAAAPTQPLANGGIHIGGGSTDVFIVGNEIEGGSRNGITLGSYSILAEDGSDTGAVTGLLPSTPDPTATTYSLVLPGGAAVGSSKGKLVAGSPLQNIQIANNRIRNSGLCGIGPVGFFNLLETIEVISIQNLTISGNTIAESLADPLTPMEFKGSVLGYGAICVPDVQGLTIRDNFITDFGNVPGAQVCGIFVLNGEQVEISRNQIVETRDWTADSNSNGTSASSSAGGAQAGVLLMFVSPPALDQNSDASAWAALSALGGSSALPLYQPGLPALTMDNNLVRVPLGRALEVVGIGPFSIANNRLSTGGAISVSSGDSYTNTFGRQLNESSQLFPGFMTALIVNMGSAIEVDAPGTTFSQFYNGGAVSDLQLADNALSASSSGAVQFANNVCQLETRASGAQGIASVLVLTPDHLIFANNHLWLDGGQTAYFDALLLAASLQVSGNRLQESVGSVFGSAVTFGVSNITTHNTATFCLFAAGLPRVSILTPNVVFDRQFCKASDALQGN